MTEARAEILRRVRAALGNDPASMPTAPPARAAIVDERPREELVAHFVVTCADYRATVERCAPAEVGAKVGSALSDAGVGRVVIPPGLERDWLGVSTAEVVVDDELSTADLNACDAVVSAASVAIAETGTIVLDHTPDQGRRALTLVPDVHVCVVREDQVVPGVAAAIRALRPAIDAHRALTWISGPSATSDIELDRVEGVHGPRNLHVLVVGE